MFKVKTVHLFCNDNQGRSMVEMLGVLAIIGVLSIGGLTAYRYAIQRYQAGKILDFISKTQLAFLENCTYADECAFGHDDYPKNARIICAATGEPCQSQNTSNASIGLIYFSFMPSVDWWMWDFYSNKNNFRLYLFDLPESVCKTLVQSDMKYLKSVSGVLPTNTTALMTGCEQGFDTQMSYRMYFEFQIP